MFSKSLLIFSLSPLAANHWYTSSFDVSFDRALSVPLYPNCFLVSTAAMLGSASTVTAGHQQGRDSASQTPCQLITESFPSSQSLRYCSLIAVVILAVDGKRGITGDDPLEMLWTSMAVDYHTYPGQSHLSALPIHILEIHILKKT